MTELRTNVEGIYTMHGYPKAFTGGHYCYNIPCVLEFALL
jgi:hypothetical protein